MAQGDIIFDADICDALCQWRWHVDNHGYAKRMRTYNNIEWDYWHMHRVVWEYYRGPIPSHLMIDHINGNRLDNRLCNLRLVTFRGNQNNQAIHRQGHYPGVTPRLQKQGLRWRATYRVGNKGVHVGYFDTPEMARDARAKALEKAGLV